MTPAKIRQVELKLQIRQLLSQVQVTQGGYISKKQGTRDSHQHNNRGRKSTKAW